MLTGSLNSFRRRFVKDYNLPINIVDSPYFEYYMDLYDWFPKEDYLGLLWEIETKYDGSLYVYGCKFMHIVSVLGFYPYAKIYCHDESSYRYISKIALEKDPEREIIKKY
jgi:hypothetical protein